MEQRPAPNPAHDLHEGLQTWAQQQQRYWHEWMEAGQLWLSWWVSTLPPVNWPPAGTVLPPAQPVRHATPPTQHAVPSQDTAAVAPKAAPARKPRAAAQRHH
ncbi:hypothetical protein [Sphaerotilus mobilis]|uniref:Uncharacterized protein n=1 Tax=Sphaerotilus mobilis TaxID=47994 RepID=A0A4V2EX27_9BURK|nr:hypothetical protein [Sphaerotilus mobilis]RZS58030.1 hypothetical protein EV685_0307 [Sphaerotilus mobilis]